MPNARGFIKSDNNRLIGTFDVDGSAYHLSIAIKPLGQEFKCSNAMLTYTNAEKLFERGNWSGSIGKTDLRLTFSEDASVAGQLDVQRPSYSRLHGVGVWTTGAVSSPHLNSSSGTRGNDSNAFTSQFQTFDMAEDPVKLERERRLLESGYPVIAIFGQSGTGKSTFINLITSEKQKVGKGLQSCTTQISVLEAKICGQRVVVIDTPGIDDTRPGMKEADVLIGIARRLESMGRNRIWVTGVLFLHRITDNKFTQTARRISDMLKSLCGAAAMNHLMLCTTMWDKVSQEEGDERLDELCDTGAWKDMIANGASIGLISSVSPTAAADAEAIVNELILNVQPVELAIQDEMINQGKTVAQTGAGKVLTEHLREAREEAEREMQAIRETMRKENEAITAKANQALLAQEREVERLKKLTEEQISAAKLDAERLRQQREKMERDMEEVRKDSAANAEKSTEALRARELELKAMKRRGEAQARTAQELVESLQSEREKAEREMDEMRKKVRAENEANAAKVQEAVSAQQRQIEDLMRQNERLRQQQPQFPWWGPLLGIARVVVEAISRR